MTVEDEVIRGRGRGRLRRLKSRCALRWRFGRGLVGGGFCRRLGSSPKQPSHRVLRGRRAVLGSGRHFAWCLLVGRRGLRGIGLRRPFFDWEVAGSTWGFLGACVRRANFYPGGRRCNASRSLHGHRVRALRFGYGYGCRHLGGAHRRRGGNFGSAAR